MKTYDFDRFLEKLPLPSLNATCRNLEGWTAPLVTPEELQETSKALEEFSGSLGQELQKKLAEYYNSLSANQSWLRPMWDDMYLSTRDSLPLNVHYFFQLDKEKFDFGQKPLVNLIRGLCWFFYLLGKEEVPPEKSPKTSTGFLSMDQFKTLAATRIPKPVKDGMVVSNLEKPGYIIVVRKGNYFLLQVTDACGGLLAGDVLDEAISGILNKDLEEMPPVGIFTALDREMAASLYSEIGKTTQNRKNLDLIENALFVVCLDEDCEAKSLEMIHHVLMKESSNRWFDKSLQLVATDGGGLGTAFEHSFSDGGAWLYCFGIVEGWVQEGVFPGAENIICDCLQPVELKWELSEELIKKIYDAYNQYSIMSGQFEFSYVETGEYSFKKIKALGTSPDSFMQAGFQLAGYKLFGCLSSCYEAVAVRNFYQGRTECCRSSTLQALAFVKSVVENAPLEEQLAAYRDFEKAHKERIALCQKGLGVERHIFGLEKMYENNKSTGRPLLFADYGWNLLNKSFFSTSNITSSAVKYFGFTPVVKGGFGIGYGVREKNIYLVVSSSKNQNPGAADFARACGESLHHIEYILK